MTFTALTGSVKEPKLQSESIKIEKEEKHQ